MPITTTRRALLRSAVAGAACLAAPALAQTRRRKRSVTNLHMPTPETPGYGFTSPPHGWLAWVREYPIYLMRHRVAIQDTKAAVAEARSVHHQITNSVTYRSDIEEEWQIAVTEGDCEDLALRTMVELVSRGLPRGALRVATSRLPQHAVLTLETRDATFVVDYAIPGVHLWTDLPYHWHGREGLGLTWDQLWQPLSLDAAIPVND